MDNEIYEPLNQFDPDLRDLMMDCITEKERLLVQLLHCDLTFFHACSTLAPHSSRFAEFCLWTLPSTRMVDCHLV